MKRWQEILLWWEEEHRDETLTLAEAYDQYREDTGYDNEKITFGNTLRRDLAEKGLLDRPAQGQYRLNERGGNKARNLRGDGQEAEPASHRELREGLEAFYRENRQDDINQAAATGEPFNIKIGELDRAGQYADSFEEQPETFLELAADAVNTVSDGGAVNVRLDADVDYWDKPVVAAKSGENIGNPVTVTGTVEWSSEINHEILSATFECTACGNTVEKEQDTHSLKSPYKCDCGNRKFEAVERDVTDVLEASIGEFQEETKKIRCVFRTETLTQEAERAFSPGNELRITGVVRNEPIARDGKKLEPYLEVLAFDQVGEQNILDTATREELERVRSKVKQYGREAFDKFAASIAPNIVESTAAKRMVAASLLGGAPKIIQGEEVDDGRIHAFLLSNPGLGKSDILEFNEKTFGKAFYASADSATGTGLTATAEKSGDGSWRLVAGKLVFADGGILAVDEFSDMNADDAKKLRTAMSRGTIPVDKASERADLPGAATVVAAGNYDEYVEEGDEVEENMPEHVASVLDRFDLIYAMRSPEDKQDVGEAVFDGFREENRALSDPEFDKRELAIYRNLARDLNPDLSDASTELLNAWMGGQRQIAKSRGNEIFVTDSNRYFDTLAKLTTMFARSRLSDTTTEEDARRAVELLVECRRSRGVMEGEAERTTNSEKAEDVLDDMEAGETREKYEVLQEMQERGVPENWAETFMEERIRDGTLSEPVQGKVQKV